MVSIAAFQGSRFGGPHFWDPTEQDLPQQFLLLGVLFIFSPTIVHQNAWTSRGFMPKLTQSYDQKLVWHSCREQCFLAWLLSSIKVQPHVVRVATNWWYSWNPSFMVLKAHGMNTNTRIVLVEENKGKNVSSILPIRPLGGSNTKLPDGVPLDQNTQFFVWSILRSREHYDISICSVRFIDMMFLDLGLLIGFDPKWEKVVPDEKKL
jgi:hypothetical protein